MAQKKHKQPAQRVLILGDLLSPHIEKWAFGLKSAGYEVFVYSFTPSAECSYNGIDQIVSTLSPDSMASLEAAATEVKRTCEYFKPHIMHAHYLTSYGIVASLTGLPYVQSVWGTDIYKLNDRGADFQAAAIAALNGADALMSTSLAMAYQTRDYTNRRIAVVPFGIDTEAFKRPTTAKTPLSDPSNIQLVLPKWLIDKKYGQSVLISALAELRRTYPNIKVVLTGDETPDQAMLADQIRDLGLEEAVNFAGRLDRDAMRELYFQSDMAVFPSFYESFGVSAIEAQAAGLPVVASATGGLLEVIEHGITGLHAKTGDIADLVQQITKLIADPNYARGLSQKAVKEVRKNYEFSANLKQLLHIYRIYSQPNL